MHEYLNLTELSEYLHLSKSTVYKKTSARLIPFSKTGKKLIFKKEAIDEWLEQNSHITVSDIEEKIVDFLKPSRNID